MASGKGEEKLWLTDPRGLGARNSWFRTKTQSSASSKSTPLQPGRPQSPFEGNHIPSARTLFPLGDLVLVELDLLHWHLPHTAYLAG